MILTVHVKPNAKETKVTGWLDSGTVVIAIHAPATEGKANEELVAFVAKSLKMAKMFVVLKRGHASKVKHLELPDGTSLKNLGQ
jgi:uncharacterized protein (TIGR00251 family)